MLYTLMSRKMKNLDRIFEKKYFFSKMNV